MKSIGVVCGWIAFLSLASVLAIGAQSACGAVEIKGQVIVVRDGDTFDLKTGSRTKVRVRLAKIDAPEIMQASGPAARSNLEKLVMGQFVVVDELEPDRYGRTVGRVWRQGLDVNGEQIRAGYAWAYPSFHPPKAYVDWESEAKRSKRGLWADPYPLPPWDYRHSNKGRKRH